MCVQPKTERAKISLTEEQLTRISGYTIWALERLSEEEKLSFKNAENLADFMLMKWPAIALEFSRQQLGDRTIEGTAYSKVLVAQEKAAKRGEAPQPLMWKGNFIVLNPWCTRRYEPVQPPEVPALAAPEGCSVAALETPAPASPSKDSVPPQQLATMKKLSKLVDGRAADECSDEKEKTKPNTSAESSEQQQSPAESKTAGAYQRIHHGDLSQKACSGKTWLRRARSEYWDLPCRPDQPHSQGEEVNGLSSEFILKLLQSKQAQLLQLDCPASCF